MLYTPYRVYNGTVLGRVCSAIGYRVTGTGYLEGDMV